MAWFGQRGEARPPYEGAIRTHHRLLLPAPTVRVESRLSTRRAGWARSRPWPPPEPRVKPRRPKALPRRGWRRWVAMAMFALLLGPPLLFAVYRFVPPLLTPLMLIRLVQGYGLD